MNDAKRKYNGCFKSGVTTPPQQYQTKGEAIGIAGEVAEIVRLRDINKDLLEALQRCATLMKNGFIPPENIGKDAEEIVSGDYANGWDAACEEFRNSRTAEIAQAAIAKAEGMSQ